MGRQPIAIVLDEFVQGGPRHIGKLDFGFFARSAGRASFGDILFAAAGRLGHLIYRSIALGRQKTPTEKHRSMIYYLAFLVNQQILVPAMRQHYFWHFSHLTHPFPSVPSVSSVP